MHKLPVISREIRPQSALYSPPPYRKMLYRAAGGGMLMPTAFAPLSQFYQRGRYNAARGLISRNNAKLPYKLDMFGRNNHIEKKCSHQSTF